MYLRCPQICLLISRSSRLSTQLSQASRIPRHFFIEQHALASCSTAILAGYEAFLPIELPQLFVRPPTPFVSQFGVKLVLDGVNNPIAYYREKLETVATSACREKQRLVSGVVRYKEVAGWSARRLVSSSM